MTASGAGTRGLLIDDDPLFLRTLSRALHRRGMECESASNANDALQIIDAQRFDFALVDLRLGCESGLDLIEPLRRASPTMRIVLLTGYASIATAVEAMKRGADNYLPKPASVEMILRALSPTPLPPPQTGVMTPLNRLEWEHIQQALSEAQGNVSAAARLLGMHRRSLQRKLAKRPQPPRSEKSENHD